MRTRALEIVDAIALRGDQQRGGAAAALHGGPGGGGGGGVWRALEIVDAIALRGDQQREGAVERPGFVLALRRRQRPPGTRENVWRQRRGALEERGSGGQAAA